MVKVYPSSYLVYQDGNVKVTNDFSDVKPLIDFREISRKNIPTEIKDAE